MTWSVTICVQKDEEAQGAYRRLEPFWFSIFARQV